MVCAFAVFNSVLKHHFVLYQADELYMHMPGPPQADRSTQSGMYPFTSFSRPRTPFSQQPPPPTLSTPLAAQASVATPIADTIMAQARFTVPIAQRIISQANFAASIAGIANSSAQVFAPHPTNSASLPLPPASTLNRASSTHPLAEINTGEAVVGLLTTASVSGTSTQHADAGSAACERLKSVAQALCECSDLFLPVRAAAEVLLNISKTDDSVLTNKDELVEDLNAKLKIILAIVEMYARHSGGRLRAPLDHRIQIFCDTITAQMEDVLRSQRDSHVASSESTGDAEAILTTFRNISNLCDVLRIDIQLPVRATAGHVSVFPGARDTSISHSSITAVGGNYNSYNAGGHMYVHDGGDSLPPFVEELPTRAMVGAVDETVKDILTRLNSGSVDKLRHRETSHKTRQSSYGDPAGCMPGTRVQILEDMKHWASTDSSKTVYWLVGMAGTGKSTIAHSLCEILDSKNVLGASFFCSRVSENARNARLIVPTIAHGLASSSPSIRSEVIKAIESDPTLAEPTYINLEDQFEKLIRHPIRTCIGQGMKTYKIIVIDAVDECTDHRIVGSLIRLMLRSASAIPLKFFITSRDEVLIRSAFCSIPELSTALWLHEVKDSVVEDDICRFVEKSLLEIKSLGLDQTLDAWPAPSELSRLVQHSGRLFIYAATALRYIRDGDQLYKSRLALMANQEPNSASALQTSTIDDLYGHILQQACASKEEAERLPMRQLLSVIVFLQNPLPIEAVISLSEIDAHRYLPSFAPVIHVPTHEDSAVAPFHASFPDFVTDPTRCSPGRCPSFPALRPSEAHGMLVVKCLELMNRSLKYNMCNVEDDLTVSRQGRTNSSYNISVISEALKYSCRHWASHFAEVQEPGPNLIVILDDFLHEHLLHWIECLSLVGELQTGTGSLLRAAATLLRFKAPNAQYDDLRLLIDDTRQFLQMNFEVIQQNCFEVYQSALVWIPTESLIRSVYATYVRRVPKVILGLSSSWGPTGLVMQNGSPVLSVAISPDGGHVVVGSEDKTVRIWSVRTGEVQTELVGHAEEVMAVAFSNDGSRVVTRSYDKTVRIRNAATGELEAELVGHTDVVKAVAFSNDGSRVVTGSYDKTVRIWNTTTGELETELVGHADEVTAVVFSNDGSRVASRSFRGTVRIWNTTTGEFETELVGDADAVKAVAFSNDGSRVASGSFDGTVRIWNTTTGEFETELVGHADAVKAVAFSNDGSRVVTGSYDKTVCIWNTTTGKLETELVGHAGPVTAVAFSNDGSRVTSGSFDGAVHIWNTTTGKSETELVGHADAVKAVAFSNDSSRVVTGSYDKTVRIWNTTTGEFETELEGHADEVTAVVFSNDGSRVASGSTVRIWNTTTGKFETELVGDADAVKAVAFSNDGSRVASGSFDGTVRIWNTTTGEFETELVGHADAVKAVAFSNDGSRVVTGWYDKTVRIWNATTGELETELEGHAGPVTAVAFSDDGSRVASGSCDKTVRIWNTTTGKVQTELVGHAASVTAVAFSNEGSRVVTGSYDETVRIWNTTTGEFETELEGHAGPVSAVVFSNDGSRVASGSRDKTVRIWNTTTGQVQTGLEGHAEGVTAVAFSNDGSRVITGSFDGTVRIWDTTTGELETELIGHEMLVGLLRSHRTEVESSLPQHWNEQSGSGTGGQANRAY
ncbi:hypothetical protein LshimejAT787_2000150 [Lyophyllum shimeji]|uniref:Nephrocystin 3-like N-terminal domain-containing protein n=1 Tax=Lyophyllum shimeji TaxID=47721 RepID=A0A9P3Q005_LYOSH|nr:hypothetical protein LshimejAT787_2000150 [Lyophyllum shimeji]